MKKIFLVLMVLTLSISGLSAIGPTTLDTDFILSVGNNKFPNTTKDEVLSTDRITGLGISVGITTMFNKTFGLYGSIGTNFGIKHEVGDGEGKNMSELSLSGNNFNTLIILTDFFAGPCIRPYNSSKGYFAINPGMHLRINYNTNTITIPITNKKTKTENTIMTVGAGASIGGGYKINSKFDIHAKCDVYYDFHSMDDEGITGFVITPAIGFGTKF